MLDGNSSAFEKLKASVQELQSKDYTTSTPEVDLHSLYELGECLKEAIKDPKHLPDYDLKTLNDCWFELARLLISNNFAMQLTATPKNKTNIKHWQLFFSDIRWTPIIKDKLLEALITHPDLKALLARKQADTNGFLLAMRVQKHRTVLKSHLKNTRHGAEVAWLIQFEEELPNNPKFKLLPNTQPLSINTDDAAMLAFLEPYLHNNQLDENQQPKKPDLFGVVAELAKRTLDFSLQVKVIELFLSKLNEKSDDIKAKVYNKFLDDVMDLGKNTANHRASHAIFKHTFPLATFVLTHIPAEQAGMTLLPIHLNWYSHKKNKAFMLKVIEDHLNVFKPLLSQNAGDNNSPRTAFDAIIDLKKSGFFSETSQSRQKLTEILSQEQELQALNPNNP